MKQNGGCAGKQGEGDVSSEERRGKGRFIESWVVVVSVEALDISYNIPTR